MQKSSFRPKSQFKRNSNQKKPNNFQMVNKMSPFFRSKNQTSNYYLQRNHRGFAQFPRHRNMTGPDMMGRISIQSTSTSKDITFINNDLFHLVS